MSTAPPAALAGLLLAAAPICRQYGLPTPTANEAIAALGIGRGTAYKAKRLLEQVLPDLMPGPGRPRSVPVSGNLVHELRGQMLDFIFTHPGAIAEGSERRRYSESFARFVLELAQQRGKVSLEDFAEAVNVPHGTIKGWVAGILPEPKPVVTDKALIPVVETVLAAYATWDGDFRRFAPYVQQQWRVGLSRQHISDILEAEGVRIPKRRGRARDASAMLGSFETFFPGAQWVGDGTQLEIELWGRRYLCNLELNVDTASAAFVGASLRPTEDSEAVVEAFVDGVATAGTPLALLLDNKSSNHTSEVAEALKNTLRIRSRLYTPTDKPHVEGAFGLFKKEAPPLRIGALTEAGLAGEVLMMVITTWLRAMNHKRRSDGTSRVEQYERAAPTEADKAEAKKALADRKRKNDKAMETRKQRLDPVTRAMLDTAFERLGLADPDRVHRIAIASWPLDAVLAGIAIFEGKKERGTLPEGVDGRYLRGIVQHVAEESEVWAIGEVLLRKRLAAQDLALRKLSSDREFLDERLEDTDPVVLLRAYVERAMKTSRRLDRMFWLRAAADVVLDVDEDDRRELLRVGARVVSTARTVSKSERHASIRFLFAKAVVVS